MKTYIHVNRRHLLAGLTTALPLLCQAETQSPELQVIHRVSASAGVQVPLDSVDLSAWLFHLTTDEYARCAPAHHGSVQAVLPGGSRVFVSVETIVGNLMVHSYVEDRLQWQDQSGCRLSVSFGVTFQSSWAKMPRL